MAETYPEGEMREQLEAVRKFVNERPTMKENNQNPLRMIELLRAELDELERAIIEEPVDHQHLELVDIIFFSLTIAAIWEIDVEGLFDLKLRRNQVKYPPEAFQQGDYEEAHRLARLLWKEMGGDERFFSQTQPGKTLG
jgi:NTP pyrophosphatase (non-canonical NTP hydrolase)